jgi:hypothetical protein
MQHLILLCFAFPAPVLQAAGVAQWITYPTPGIPRIADGKPNLTAPAPRTGGHVDLGGVWLKAPGIVGRLSAYMPVGSTIPVQPWADEAFKKRFPPSEIPSTKCLLHGVPDNMLVPEVFKIIQTPGVTVILFEEFNHFRQIFTDGRPLPEPVQPAWLGYSVGKWEGDTFVVDTAGFNDKAPVDGEHLHTESLHTTERFRRIDFGHMEVSVTIDDPKAYDKPWTATVPFELQPDTELIESICENEKDVVHLKGAEQK